MPKLYYLQSPVFDINPESDTAPKLGSIFSRLDRLTVPLNQFDYVSVPAYLINRSSISEFSETVKKKFGSSTGINANAAQGTIGTIDLVYAFSRDKNNVYACDLLETEEFEPDEKFVSDCINSSRPV